jgi:hypothetical protein
MPNREQAEAWLASGVARIRVQYGARWSLPPNLLPGSARILIVNHACYSNDEMIA